LSQKGNSYAHFRLCDPHRKRQPTSTSVFSIERRQKGRWKRREDRERRFAEV